MTGYVYRGAKPDGLGLDLEAVNAEIMAERATRGRALGGHVDPFTWPQARTSPECGTERGYRAHLAAGAAACGSCAAAHAWYGRKHAKAEP